jgi:hypothetical protein
MGSGSGITAGRQNDAANGGVRHEQGHENSKTVLTQSKLGGVYCTRERVRDSEMFIRKELYWYTHSPTVTLI